MGPVKPPPIISTKPPPAQPAWVFVGMLAALALARFTDGYQLPWPRCALRLLTGLPCPFCGGTRALQAAARLDWWQAFALNPLAFLLGVGVTLWFVAWATDQLFQTGVLARLTSWRQAVFRLRLLAAILVLNWVYLCFTLPP